MRQQKLSFIARSPEEHFPFFLFSTRRASPRKTKTRQVKGTPKKLKSKLKNQNSKNTKVVSNKIVWPQRCDRGASLFWRGG
jgi:hypothetical protein